MQHNEASKYSGPQQELYATARLSCLNFINSQTLFEAFSPRYNKMYGAKFNAEIDEAEAMPSDNARSGLSTDNRILLSRAASVGLIKWQNLKRYILEAYEADRSDNMLKIAGQPLYTSASGNHWQSVKGLMNEGSLFIKNHQAELVANENMPPNFGVDFDAAKDSYDALQIKFFGGVTDGSANTQQRISANNALYAKLTKMFSDAQIIFADDEPTRQQFVFSNVKAIISGISQAGIRGFVTNAVTGMPIEGAIIATANNIYNGITDADGRVDFKGMVANDYSFTISADGYTAQMVAVTIKIGTVSALNVSLALVVMEI
jgi:hypothetical protein